LGGGGVRNFAYPIDFTIPLASNTAYCATAHTRDVSRPIITRPLFTHQQKKLS